ncbi:unnamed protein product [Owenia fusiformis]|uniref:Uncharacterized protein n=1 Tax=Owenia fusiformis TaxID=6347 RepID=A0A8J1TGL6_OWEFU|nr:unnamed protein product [Owenia fusiformis]
MCVYTKVFCIMIIDQSRKMQDSEKGGLSAKGLRKKLYRSLRERGHIDSMKSQLREKIVNELSLGSLTGTPSSIPRVPEESSLLLRAANSLVVDHLGKCGYDYSLSVFKPESGCDHEKVFTTRDLLQLLNISPQSKLYKTLIQNIPSYQKKGFLWQLLCEISSYHSNSTQNEAIQTEPIHLGPISSLDKKLQQVESAYESEGDLAYRGKSRTAEERILSYQRQLEERSRNERKVEFERFRDTELARMRLEEQNNCRKQIDAARREMEQLYQNKSDGLLERERHAIERLQRQQEISERETFNQRQSILEEIQLVRQREADLKRQGEINAREKRLQEEKLESLQNTLREREKAVTRLELDFDNKLEDQINRYKIQEQSRLLEKQRHLEAQEARLTEETRSLANERLSIENTTKELQEKRIQVKEFESQLQQMRQETITMQSQKDVLNDKVRQMLDYPNLRSENAVLKNEIEATKMRLAESKYEVEQERKKHEDLLRETRERLSMPSPETVLLQRELDRARDHVKQEKAVAEHQVQEIQRQLKEELERNKDLMSKYEEQSLQKKEMTRELEDLRHQLLQTQQALNNEIYRNPKPSTAQRSRVRFDQDEVPVHDTTQHPTDLYFDTSLRKTLVEPGLLLEMDLDSYNLDNSAPPFVQSQHVLDDFDRILGPINGSGGHSRHFSTQDPQDSNDVSKDVVQETRERLQDLEREAENLEANYRRFQTRIIDADGLDAQAQYASKNRDTFRSIMATHTPVSSPPRQTLTQHSPIRSTYHSPSRTPWASAGRPLSSTPYKERRKIDVELHSPPTLDPQLETHATNLPSFGLSALTNVSSPENRDIRERPQFGDFPKDRKQSDDGQRTESDDFTKQWEQPDFRGGEDKQPGDIALSDLDARPGSPSVMVVHVAGSQHSDELDNQAVKGEGDRRSGILGDHQPINLQGEPAEPDDKQGQASKKSDEFFDSIEQNKQKEQEEKRRQEEEDRRWEEERRQRQEERRKRDEEERLRQERELAELQKKEESKETVPVTTTENKVEQEKDGKDIKKDEEAVGMEESGIDPVMQKYMQMVQQQKTQEKKVATKAVGLWKQNSKERMSPPTSDHDISLVSEPKSIGGGSDDDFEW